MATPSSWMMGENFSVRAKHHESIEALWTTKWKFPVRAPPVFGSDPPLKQEIQCSLGVYPFHDGKLEDFEKVFEFLIKENINDANSDAYTEAFFPVCNALLKEATAATASNQHAQASSLYLRVASLYRISRFPYLSTPLKWKAYEAQKAAYMMASAAWIDPIREVFIPHTHAKGSDKPEIPVYVRLPSQASRTKPVPTVLLMTGLDGYRPDNTQRTYEFLRRGWGCVIAEIPGTADCPADPKDPQSPDRLWDSVFAWMRKQGVFNMKKIYTWGLSAGGYYAVRVAHTHREVVAGSVAHGAGTHHFFSRQWLDRADDHEYPFDLTPALAQKYGYDTVDEFKSSAQKKFSLVQTGVVHKPSTRLLLINGICDGLMPVEDSLLMLEYGTPKEARLFPTLVHMAYPKSNAFVYPWLESVMKDCC